RYAEDRHLQRRPLHLGGQRRQQLAGPDRRALRVLSKVSEANNRNGYARRGHTTPARFFLECCDLSQLCGGRRLVAVVGVRCRARKPPLGQVLAPKSGDKSPHSKTSAAPSARG